MYTGDAEVSVLLFFWKNSSTVEIVKDDYLQRIRFRVKDYVSNYGRTLSSHLFLE